MGLLGVVNNDIKRVIAYSTLSQLGYMTVALGASAYGAGIFHLMTHAFFKALLFLAAGSVIIAMHHEQDMRRMGGLRKYMPITYWTFLVGLARADRLSRHVGLLLQGSADRCGARLAPRGSRGYAYFCVLAGVFVTALYTFRVFFMTFHGRERMDEETRHHLHESPWVVTVPLILLAIPSLVVGWITVQPVLFGGYFGGAIQVLPANDVLREHRRGVPRPGRVFRSAFTSPRCLLRARPACSRRGSSSSSIRRGRMRPSAASSGCTRFWSTSTASTGSTSTSSLPLARGIGATFWHGGDEALIDGAFVNGSARLVGWLGSVMRYAQSGYLYHYAFAMILGLASLLLWLIWRP